MGRFNEMKRRAHYNHIERKKNRIITRQNIGMKIRALPGELKASANRWWYNLVNDIRDIKSFKGTLRLGIWLSMIAIVVVWAFFYGKIQHPILEKVIEYSHEGGYNWTSLTAEIARKVPFIPNFDEILLNLSGPFLGSTLIAWIAALISFICQFVIWCVPAIFLVNHYSKTKGIRSFARMFRRPFSLRHCWGCLVVILGWISFSSIAAFISKGGFYLSSSYVPTKLLTTVIAFTICEEILLRGWFLNALNTRGGPIYSSVMISIFYLLLLLPRWLPRNVFSNIPALAISVLVTFTFTFCLCIAFNRSRSLWTSMGIRAIWATCTVLLPGSFF